MAEPDDGVGALTCDTQHCQAPLRGAARAKVLSFLGTSGWSRGPEWAPQAGAELP